MDKTVKEHLDAIAEHVKDKKQPFVFLMGIDEGVFSCKNCGPYHQANLMINYIEANEEVENNFTNAIMAIMEADEAANSLKEKLEEKLDEKGIIINEVKQYEPTEQPTADGTTAE